MHRCLPRLALVLGVLPFGAGAADVYKCTAADGTVGFQDHPCIASTREERIHFVEYATPPAVQTPAAEPAAEAPSAPTVQAPATARAALPAAFLCTRFDGSRYLSDDGVGATNWVPYEAVQPNRDLASAYGGRNGAGVSAPGTSEPPHTTSAYAGSAYVRVDDECRRVAPEEACAFLQKELDEVHGRLRRSFSDTEAGLRQRQHELEERMRGC